MAIMSVETKLTNEEKIYLLGTLKDARAYYGLLAGNSNCSSRNRQLHNLVESIASKLQAQTGKPPLGIYQQTK